MYIYNFNDSMNGVPMLNVDMVTTSSSMAAVPAPAPPSVTSTTTSNLTVGTCTTTPLTPEILNSVMAMTNPLEYSFPANTATTNSTTTKLSQSSDSHSSSSGSPFDSPMATTSAGASMIKEATTPTVQQTCSQLIKTSLKLSLEMKRKMSTSDSSSVDTSICKMIKQDLDDMTSDEEMIMKPTRSGGCLSPEDEDRRRRRRERNKIAATKCRMKKRERTVNLVSEAETLEAQNIDLKTQMRNLEIERRSLTEMLQMHAGSCSLGAGFQVPNISATIAKYLNEIGMGGAQSIEASTSGKSETATKTRNSSKTTQKMQKIPSVSTLKFSTRRSQQIHNKPPQTPHIMSLTTPVTTTTSPRNCMINTMNNASPIQDCKPLPSMDMGFCEGRNESLTPTSGYCKSLMSGSSDCYAMSSPDSGFIKSPVDMANYTTLPQIKSDYIPNCDTGMLGDAGNPDGSMEFILKSELVDANDSPYTSVQSADRFLFDGVNEFDTDMDAATNPNHSSLIETQTHHMHDGLKEHLLLQGMNNNNSSHINNNHHHNLDPNTNPNLMHNFGTITNLPVISSVLPPLHSASIIEFNTSCQQYIDNSLLKGDFLSQNCDYLDQQITTDLDSGVASYANSSGCLA